MRRKHRNSLFFEASVGELTQVPVGDGVIVVVHFVVFFLLLLDAVALVLLRDRAGAMEARPDVLLVVWNGFVLLDVALVVVNERDPPNSSGPGVKINRARMLLVYSHLYGVIAFHFFPCTPEQQLCLNGMNTYPSVHNLDEQNMI